MTSSPFLQTLGSRPEEPGHAGYPGGLIGVWGLLAGLMVFQEAVGDFTVKWVRGILGTFGRD